MRQTILQKVQWRIVRRLTTGMMQMPSMTVRKMWDAYGRTNLYPQGTLYLQADRMSRNQPQ